MCIEDKIKTNENLNPKLYQLIQKELINVFLFKNVLFKNFHQ